MSVSPSSTPQQFLDAVYSGLELSDGDLVETASSPEDGMPAEQWRSKGEWLMLGKRMGAERVFFVADNPVVVFSALQLGAGEAEIVAKYRQAWSMGRASCLFVALEGELRIYALNKPPPRTLEDQRRLKPLEIISQAANVADVLAAYHRDRLESGLLFEDPQYVSRTGRADERLLRDVSAATDALEKNGLPRQAAHALIERVILIRYLEDREVIGAEYFRKIAAREASWRPGPAVARTGWSGPAVPPSATGPRRLVRRSGWGMGGQGPLRRGRRRDARRR